jgi:hypothetical protein
MCSKLALHCAITVHTLLGISNKTAADAVATAAVAIAIVAAVAAAAQLLLLSLLLSRMRQFLLC